MKKTAARPTGGSSRPSLIASHKFVVLAILCAWQFSVATMHAQVSASYEFETMEELTLEELTPASRPGQAQDLLLDHAVKSFWGNMSDALAEWRENHFTMYLFAVSAGAGFGMGILAALLGHYGADPRAKWRDVCKKTTRLAAACGLGVSVLLVGMMLSVPSHGRLTYLLLSATISTLGAALVCHVCFLILRRFRQRRAEIAGIFFNEGRMGGV